MDAVSAPRWLLLALLAGGTFLICLEMAWNWRAQKQNYALPETLANLAIFAGLPVARFMLDGYQIFWLNLFSAGTPWHWDESRASFLLTFVLTDFAYYWHHRAMHVVKFFWAFHVVHHSGMRFNLTTSFRLNWFAGVVSIFFYLPLVLLGCPPRFVLASLALGLLYQFFLHTEAIGRLPWIEGILNTPSAHRVHHGSNERYLDKNFGGVLMIWDRLFDSYKPESEPLVYGITTGFVSHNPFTLVLHGFADLVRGRLNQRG
jgi:sterol desaturase/sphingolipid hydroxylase (fatty acid hydroxylase superfamily)